MTGFLNSAQFDPAGYPGRLGWFGLTSASLPFAGIGSRLRHHLSRSARGRAGHDAQQVDWTERICFLYGFLLFWWLGFLGVDQAAQEDAVDLLGAPGGAADHQAADFDDTALAQYGDDPSGAAGLNIVGCREFAGGKSARIEVAKHGLQPLEDGGMEIQFPPYFQVGAVFALGGAGGIDLDTGFDLIEGEDRRAG